jgi:hypothetical protein
LTHGEFPPFTYSVDAETGDVLESRSILVEGPVHVPVRVLYEDYREVEGRRIAFREVSENEMSGRSIIEVQSLEFGGKVEDSAFRLVD